MTRIKTAYMIVADTDAARAFYASVLGFPVRFADADRWVQFDGGGVALALAGPAEAPAGASGTVLVFEVDDLEEVGTRVAREGGAMVSVRDMGAHGTVATATDPDGNLIQFFKRGSAS